MTGVVTIYHSHINECRDSTLEMETRFSLYIFLSSLLNNRFIDVVWATDSMFYNPQIKIGKGWWKSRDY